MSWVVDNEKKVFAAILLDEKREEGAEELPPSNTFSKVMDTEVTSHHCPLLGPCFFLVLPVQSRIPPELDGASSFLIPPVTLI